MKNISLISLLFLLFSGCTTLTPQITKINLCSSVEEDSVICTENIEVFDKDIDRIFLSITVENAPKTTQFTANWKYVEDEKIVLISEDVIPPIKKSELSDKTYFTYLENQGDQPWHTGDYEILLTNNLENLQTEIIKFTIE